MQFHPEGQYLDVHQTRDREPSEYENLLGDALERSFAAGVTDLEGVVTGLVDYGVPGPDGQSWSVELLRAELKRLGV
ncbi:MAG: recombinase-like helix-turn-helix domain-containing protein [Beijerinckiaceae bacterium]